MQNFHGTFLPFCRNPIAYLTYRQHYAFNFPLFSVLSSPTQTFLFENKFQHFPELYFNLSVIPEYFFFVQLPYPAANFVGCFSSNKFVGNIGLVFTVTRWAYVFVKFCEARGTLKVFFLRCVVKTVLVEHQLFQSSRGTQKLTFSGFIFL